MFTRIVVLLTTAMIVALPAKAMADDQDVVTTFDGEVTNYCIGGGDDRKLIPYDGEIRNPFRETTHFGCESEGGTPTFMPDLDPVIKDGKLV